jgi:ribosomal protein S18 acetylase RimI-like enzyme
MHPAVIRLTPSDAERYVQLRREMLAAAPWAFSATPEADIALDLAHLRSSLGEHENAIFAVESAEPPSTLVAAAGVFRMKNPKFAHRAQLWGVYVDSRHRGRGLGRAVVASAIELARSWSGVDFIDLGVSANSPEACRLYESLGFEAWGREPQTLQYDGQRYDEIYLTLRIERVAGD